ncbi:hypothetical protein V2E39_15810 [Chryseobacterium arthrosphaerae]|uniref:Uncharacterized protein n=1 Tax=Chryseobacterium arthrosphaerae TaxID=651561 RepID=A0A1B8ZHT6_9FLAO|nr:hypothetical protein [Chryseobacterium arthrosphaerae]AYZ14319.1 hypothetical protein EGY05_21350 [Chryseobacterium arthrosphaerae]MDG4651471.1 hypothetical protein [Chryseobacterium arthrosphaerae]OCA71151.1 hypothetical protein BBI00_15515 [Chryseobacterium arthrosphaerae]QUY55164.1 hypothetical protein I2F65_20205 [Chryseobacterium arthrosphaerae]UEQ75044.1 hypothetical protein J8N07_15410 [Chryseobacterium arthrosphaerae]
MAKTILIATDYSLESLNILKKVLKEKDASEDQNQYNILLTSGYDYGDSIRDLLFNTKTSVFNKIRPEEFCDAYGIIKNKYPHLVNKIVCDIFTGSFQRTFNQYVKAENIEEAYYSSSVKSKGKGKFDLIPYIKKCKDLQSREIAIEVREKLPERGRLAEIFVEV